MVFILEKLMGTYKKLSAQNIWECLGELYDLNALVSITIKILNMSQVLFLTLIILMSPCISQYGLDFK